MPSAPSVSNFKYLSKMMGNEDLVMLLVDVESEREREREHNSEQN